MSAAKLCTNAISRTLRSRSRYTRSRVLFALPLVVRTAMRFAGTVSIRSASSATSDLVSTGIRASMALSNAAGWKLGPKTRANRSR